LEHDVALNKRERHLAIGVVVVVGGLLAYQYVWDPFWAAEQKAADDLKQANAQLDKADRLFRRERDLKRVWNDMVAGGLSGSADAATSQAMNAVNAWMQRARVATIGLKPERTTTENRFLVSSFHLEGGGNMASISRLINALETADIPVRINELQIRPQKKEGTDDLKVDLSVSTLSIQPEADKPAARPAAAPAKTLEDQL
jgi:hypothetical protein